MRLGTITVTMLATAFGAVAQMPNLTPSTPLLQALAQNNTTEAEKLLAAGADPNEARFAGFAPIFFPVMHNNLALFRAMKDHGADIKAQDKTGSNLLMWAASNESGSSELVEELLRLGLSPNQADLKGETALTWALRRGSDTPAVRALRNAGASDTHAAQRAAESAIALLQKSGTEFVKVSGCTSCHHQSLPQMASGIARTRGVHIDEQVAAQQVKAVIAMFLPVRDEMKRGIARFPDPAVGVSYALLGLAAEGYPGDETTEAMAHLVATQQLPDGSFRTLPARPPLESSDLTATTISIRAMQLYGKKADEDRIKRAAQWLEKATPHTTEDRAMQLLGLKWAGAEDTLLKRSAAALLSAQREDGGWSQLPGLETDSYATGQVMVALERSGMVSATDPAYRRGVEFLLRTQLADGSWLVRTRSFPVQAYKDSGYPHGKNQWISASGSSWAAMALSLSMPASQKPAQVIPGL